MQRKPFLLIVSAVLFAALAAGGVGYFGANPSVEQVAVSAPFAACSAMLKEAVAALNSLQTEADTERVGEALGKALDAVKSLPEPTEADGTCISRGLQAVAEAWWAAESRVGSETYVYAPVHWSISSMSAAHRSRMPCRTKIARWRPCCPRI